MTIMMARLRYAKNADLLIGFGAFIVGAMALDGGPESIVWGGFAMMIGALLLAVSMSRW